MHIAYDAKRLFNNRTGLGNYSRTLVENQKLFYPENKYSLLAPHVNTSKFLSGFKDFEIIDPEPKVSSFWRSFHIYKDINKINPNIYHGLSNELPFTSSRIKAKKIVTIHDVFFEKFPHDFTFLDRYIYRQKTQKACELADRIIAISQATKDDLIELFDVPSSKIQVVYQSCSEIFQSDKGSTFENRHIESLPTDYFLFVGTINQRKNLLGLIKALALIDKSNRIPLVVVGSGKSSFLKLIKEEITQCKLEREVFLLGNFDNNSLKSLYKNALFTCLPSFYEGFGIPIIESLFCNTPVLTSNVSALPEAAGPCGLFFDPQSIDEMSSVLHEMMQNESIRNELKQNIQSHISQFSIQSTATDLNLLYKNSI